MLHVLSQLIGSTHTKLRQNLNNLNKEGRKQSVGDMWTYIHIQEGPFNPCWCVTHMVHHF